MQSEVLAQEKCDGSVVDGLAVEVEHMRVRLGMTASQAAVDERLRESQREITKLGAALQVAEGDVLTLRKETAQLLPPIQQANEARMQLEEVVQAQDSFNADRFRDAKEDVSRVEAKLMQLWTHAAGLSEKANETDVLELKHAMNSLAVDLKDKSQAVLFGARCLSCNRVFDDVEQHAGVVDVRADRQQAKLYAQMQQALHNPSADPMKPIKMIAVKVGRPGTVAGTGSGGRCVPFQGRDALSIACDVSDLHLLPVSQSCAAKSAESPASRPATSNQVRSPPRPVGSAPPGTGRRGQRESSKAVEAKIDPRHTLAQLLGRP
jgi:hypothetical protein